jgi:hypothetical protein
MAASPAISFRSERQVINAEAQMTNDERGPNTNDEDAASRSASSFGLSFELQHSDFVILLNMSPESFRGWRRLSE